MNKRVTLKMNMLLQSDTILGSGYSIPGGEDIAVCQDKKGYPYMKGSVFKGLLRESMENLALWTGKSRDDIDKMTGLAGWNGEAEERRIHVTALKLISAPENPQDCYEMRTFTSLENGIVKDGTLRTATCISRGNSFSGELICSEQDTEFIQQAIAGIKWVGTLRNRGFGRVLFKSELKKENLHTNVIGEAKCIHYRLKTILPVIVTDINRSKGYHYETQGYIPGSAVRGMVAGFLAANNPEWFLENKKALLRNTKFLDVVPVRGKNPVIPAIKGFYEKKDGSDFQSVLKNGELSLGVKRAGLGSFCSLNEGKISYWTAETAGTTRIRKERNDEEKLMFQSHYLCENQEFDGYIILSDENMASEISKAFTEYIWLGADRYEGFGKCEVISLDVCEEPEWRKEYGYHIGDKVGNTLYMLAVSPICMLDEMGQPCGINGAEIADKLKIESVNIEYSSTSVSDYHTYNRTWRCSSATVRMYDRGSIFKLITSSEVQVEKLLELQKKGIGIRKAEGCGQILFLRADIYENLQGKVAMENKETETETVSVRRAGCCWIMNQQEDWIGKISRSQLGEIQGLLEKALAADGDTEELEKYFNKNIHERGARHGERFEKIQKFIKNVLQTPLMTTLGVKCTDTKEKKLELLCMLFDYSRKGRED